jgi:small subunit ribosomal protein S2
MNETKIPALEEMLKAGMHFGHRTSRWHPKMKPYIFMSRNGIHIMDLVKSRTMLTEAIVYMAKLKAEGKKILFVGTKNQAKKEIRETANALNMPFVTERWLGGSVTNFQVIKKAIRKYRDLMEKRDAGKLERYTKKERLNFEREIARLDKKVGGLAMLERIPDAVFIWDIKTEETAVAEAKLKKIPIIAVCDSNVNPTGIKYIIPSNDDASKAIKLVLGAIKENLLSAKPDEIIENK